MANDQLVIFKYVSGATRKGYMQRKRQLVIVVPISVFFFNSTVIKCRNYDRFVKD